MSSCFFGEGKGFLSKRSIGKRNYHPQAIQFDQHDQKKGFLKCQMNPLGLSGFVQGWGRVRAMTVGI